MEVRFGMLECKNIYVCDDSTPFVQQAMLVLFAIWYLRNVDWGLSREWTQPPPYVRCKIQQITPDLQKLLYVSILSGQMTCEMPILLGKVSTFFAVHLVEIICTNRIYLYYFSI